MKQDGEHHDAVSNVVCIVDIHVTRAATGSGGASSEEASEVVDDICKVERHVITTVATDKFRLGWWITSIDHEGCPRDAPSWKANAGTWQDVATQ